MDEDEASPLVSLQNTETERLELENLQADVDVVEETDLLGESGDDLNVHMSHVWDLVLGSIDVEMENVDDAESVDQDESLHTDEKDGDDERNERETSEMAAEVEGDDVEEMSVPKNNVCTAACYESVQNSQSPRCLLPCGSCGIITDKNIKSTYYWETMNFCSNLCVGNYQMSIGAGCATCSNKVPWASLGKYCVRFGGDVQQFCTAICLETYKKNARVCFHCHVDIKKLSKVILATISDKTTTKEFCSINCVEMSIDRNLHRTVTCDQKSLCTICSLLQTTYKELVIPSGNYKTCSDVCWNKLLETKNVRCPLKCEICTKVINSELQVISPALCVSREQKIYGFCSATCKNVYVLKSRQILQCTTCSVKKYNYDMIEHVGGNSTPAFYVCSLNCIPKPSQQIMNLRDTAILVATVNDAPSLSFLSQSVLPSSPDQSSNSNNNANTRIRLVDVNNRIQNSSPPPPNYQQLETMDEDHSQGSGLSSSLTIEHEHTRLKQFFRDAAEIESWILENLEFINSESFLKNPAVTPSKLEQYIAFETELADNTNTIQCMLVALRENVIHSSEYEGARETVEAKLDYLNAQWKMLIMRTSEKSLKLKGVKKKSEDAQKELGCVQNLIDKQHLVEEDINLFHDERIGDMNLQADSLSESETCNLVPNEDNRELNDDLGKHLRAVKTHYRKHGGVRKKKDPVDHSAYLE